MKFVAFVGGCLGVLAIAGCGSGPNYTGLVDDYLFEQCASMMGRYDGTTCNFNILPDMEREAYKNLLIGGMTDFEECPDGSSKSAPSDECFAIAAGLVE